MVLLSASHQGRTLPRQEPQEGQHGEAQSPAPGEGRAQAPAYAAGCPAGKQPGKGGHAAALERRLSSRSSRGSLGAGISSAPLGKDPSLADAGHMDAKRLRTRALSALEKRRLRGDLVALYSFPRRRGGGEGAADLFSLGSSGSSRGNASKLRQGRFRLDIRKPFLTERVVRGCNRLPGEAVGAPCLSLPYKQARGLINFG